MLPSLLPPFPCFLCKLLVTAVQSRQKGRAKGETGGGHWCWGVWGVWGESGVVLPQSGHALREVCMGVLQLH